MNKQFIWYKNKRQLQTEDKQVSDLQKKKRYSYKYAGLTHFIGKTLYAKKSKFKKKHAIKLILNQSRIQDFVTKVPTTRFY